MPNWISLEDKTPLSVNTIDVRVLLVDGSEINCWAQSDGYYYWKGGGQEIFIPEHLVTHWLPILDPSA